MPREFGKALVSAYANLEKDTGSAEDKLRWMSMLTAVGTRRRTMKGDKANFQQTDLMVSEMARREREEVQEMITRNSNRDLERIDKSAKHTSQGVTIGQPTIGGKLVSDEQMAAYWSAKRAFDAVVYGQRGEGTLYPADPSAMQDPAWVAMMLGLDGWKVAEVYDDDGDTKLYHAASDQWGFVDDTIGRLMHNIELEHERNSVSNLEPTHAEHQGADGHSAVAERPDHPVGDHAFKVLRRLAKTSPGSGVHQPERGEREAGDLPQGVGGALPAPP